MENKVLGYARCSSDKYDHSRQLVQLIKLGVAPGNIYVDRGYIEPGLIRAGLEQALLAMRHGDTLVVPQLFRLAGSMLELRGIGEKLCSRGVKLQLGGDLYDPSKPVGKVFFEHLLMFADFEEGLIIVRREQSAAMAQADCCDRTRKTKLTARERSELRRIHCSGEWSVAELAKKYRVSPPTVYRVLNAKPES